jgi:hypothetical protein
VPAYLAFGANDAFFPPPAGDQQRDLFSGSHDVTLATFPNTGHGLFLERTRFEVRGSISSWLRRHRLAIPTASAARHHRTRRHRRHARTHRPHGA